MGSNYKRDTETFSLFRKSIENYRKRLSDMSVLFYQDESHITISSRCAGGLLSGLSSELYEILQDDFSDDDFSNEDE